ncbi:hypothetical protein N9089_04335 [Crocinitomicaceae bacterium]|nr:hypothetical protein [Crocinitomicaceae bacterium]
MSLFHTIPHEVSPRETLAMLFPSVGELPIGGGWGYQMESPLVIDKDDPIVNPDLPFDGVAIEKLFIEKRLYIELISIPDEGEKYSNIEWEIDSQKLIQSDERRFDLLWVSASAMRDDYPGFPGAVPPDHPEFQDVFMQYLMLKRSSGEQPATFRRQYWFDITSFFSRECH